MAVLVRVLTGTLAVLLLASCASVPPWPDKERAGQSTAPIQLDVPFFPQQQYQCGPAALASMLSSQGVAVQPDDLVSQVYLPELEGSLKVELVAAARRYGMLVYPLSSNLTDLLAEIDAGHPVMVMQNLGFDWFPQWHFAVVVGYDPVEEDLILHTDTRRANRQPMTVFYRTWQRAGRWAAVVLPPGDFPATAQALPYLEAAHDLETTGQTGAAYSAYQSAAVRWQDQPAPLLGMGNIAYAKQEWVEATGYYSEVVKRFPWLAPGWNNLAHSLARAGCAESSVDALACANRLREENYPSDLQSPSTSSSTALPEFSCPVIQCPIAE